MLILFTLFKDIETYYINSIADWSTDKIANNTQEENAYYFTY